MTTQSWVQRLQQVVETLSADNSESRAYAGANAAAVAIAVEGGGAAGKGYRLVVNMSSKNVPSFCRGRAYKNAYELEDEAKAAASQSSRIGELPKVSKKRVMVDTALETVANAKKEELYFVAVELNGSGMGFYGDCCLVLNANVGASNVAVLDRNSYDLVREPLKSTIDASNNPARARAEAASRLSGRLKQDVSSIAAIKVIESWPVRTRLLTTETMSRGVLQDEDYIEVLLTQSFTVRDIEEVRLSAADIALDERIRSRNVNGAPLSHAEQLWRRRRRVAEGRLTEAGIGVRVVTTAGRSRE